MVGFNTVTPCHSCTKCVGSPILICPVATQFPGHECMDDLTTERSFGSQATWVIYVSFLFFDMLSMGVCTTRHWHTSGRLVQELNVCTVGLGAFVGCTVRV